MSPTTPLVSSDHVPVLIAGGGLVGLSAAMFLAQHGVASLIVEPLLNGSPLPRAAHFHLRTLELFRLAGVGDEVTEQSTREFLPEGAIVAMDSLAGRKVADIIPSLNEGVDAVSPCRRLFVSQPGLEPILRRRAHQAGAEELTGHEVVDLEQNTEGVTTTVASVDGNERRLVTADYLVGADGAHSRVREVLGIPFDGRGTFSNSITIYFRADVSAQIGGKPLSVIYINNSLFGGFFRLDKSCTSGFLVVNSVHDAADGNAAADTSEQRLIHLVRAGAGIPDLDVQIEGVARWRATAQAAQSFGTDRVFLAGDSAHLMPPNGGFGGNTGIHDAHNLAWKLAACLNGIAGPNLLSTYDAERRPVCAFTAEQAYSRYVTRTAPELGTDGTQPVAHDFEIELGYVYRSLAIATERDTPPMHGDPRDLAGAPGSRAPHVALVNEGTSQSTIDLIGHEFCVLAGSQGAAWAEAANVVGAATPGSGLRGYQIGGDSPIIDPGGDFAVRFGISEHGAVLARPDGFIAWRSRGSVDDPTQVLRAAVSMALGFEAPPTPHQESDI